MQYTENFNFNVPDANDYFHRDHQNANWQNAETYLKKIEENAGKKLVGDEFDEKKSYSIGDYVIYENVVYTFLSEKEAGKWDESIVESTSVMNIISEQNKKMQYTSEETIIGTWIDNNILYRKCFTGNKSTSGEIVLEDNFSVNPISIQGCLNGIPIGGIHSGDSSINTINYLNIRVSGANKLLLSSPSTGFYSVIIDYTKK